jgi:hypothetical protein
VRKPLSILEGAVKPAADPARLRSPG